MYTYMGVFTFQVWWWLTWLNGGNLDTRGGLKDGWRYRGRIGYMNLDLCHHFYWFLPEKLQELTVDGISMGLAVIIWPEIAGKFMPVLLVYCIGVGKVSLGSDLIQTRHALLTLFGLTMTYAQHLNRGNKIKQFKTLFLFSFCHWFLYNRWIYIYIYVCIIIYNVSPFHS